MGQIPSFKVWEDDNFLAFLTIEPIKPGHTLVIPKKHENYLFDLDDETLKEFILASKKVATKLKEVFKPKSGKVGVIVYGFDAPHAHIHLVPMDQPGDLSFSKQHKASNQELELILEKIKTS
jgi:histidine triad (HIT) family protein